MDHFYLQTRYFNKFKCLAGECPQSCCDGWGVLWYKDEVCKLKEANSVDKLKTKIESKFIISKNDNYLIEMDKDLRCPFHNYETGLCEIQKELGEDYLGAICTNYPRKNFVNTNTIMRWCVTSCPAVMDFLINEKDSVKLDVILTRNYNGNLRTASIDDIRFVNESALFKNRFNMTKFFSDLFTTNTRSIEDSIILGSIAVKHFSESFEKNKGNDIPKIIKDLTNQFNDNKITESLAGIKPNYQLKFKLVNNMIVEQIGGVNIIDNLHDGNKLIVERYLEGLDNFHKTFDDKPFILNNIITNIFYDLYMPIGIVTRTLFENYSYFTVCSAIIITCAAAVGYRNKDILNDFKYTVGRFMRVLAHTKEEKYSIMDEMKELGLTSPAHLALIIK